MAVIECETCHRKVSDLAPTCPHCGADPRQSPPTKNIQNSESKASDSSIKKVPKPRIGMILGLFAGALLFGFVMITLCPKTLFSSSGNQQLKQEKAAALKFCQGYVKSRLKAPATAVFPGEDAVVAYGNQRYDVHSSVDSQNSFGALIRTRFTCKAQIKKGQWEVLSLDIIKF